MNIVKTKKGIRARWTEITKFDVNFPPKTWSYLQGLMRKKDTFHLIYWCMQNSLDSLIVMRILSEGPKRIK